MRLGRILKTYINNLYEELENSKDLVKNDDIKSLTMKQKLVLEFLDDIEKDIANMRGLDFTEILSILDCDSPKIKESIRIIKLSLIGKYNEGLDIELTDSQIGFINEFLVKLRNKNSQLLEEVKTICEQNNSLVALLDKLEYDILMLEDLYLKITSENNEPLDKEDFELLYTIIENPKFPYNQKKNLLLSIIEYNKSDYSKESDDVTLEEVKNCYRDFGFDDSFMSLIDKNKTEVLKNFNETEVRKILGFLQLEDPAHHKINVLKRFTAPAILTITLYGSITSVKNRFDAIRKSNLYLDIFFETPSLWINNLKKDLMRKGSIKREKNGQSKQTSLYSLSREITYEELVENEEYLISKGLKVSIGAKENMKVLKTPHERIVENYQIYENYGFFDEHDVEDFSPSALSFSMIADKCDMFTELGLLNDSEVDYLKQFPSAINLIRKETYPLLYKLKREHSLEEYYDMIFSSAKGNRKYLDGSLTRNVLTKLGYNLSTPDRVRAFEEENFIDLNNPELIPNYNLYSETINKIYPIEYEEDILEDEFIKNLENNYRVKGNKYIYRFGNQTISRLKVLRCYSALKKMNLHLESDALIYVITRGTYMDLNTFKEISDAINYKNIRGVK